MVLARNSTTHGTVLQLPIFSDEERQKMKDLIYEHKALRDKDNEGFLSDVLDKMDKAEATMRNMYKTLTVYRNRIPKIIRAMHEKKKEVSK